MQSIFEQIIIGVVGGVFTSALLYIAGLIFFRIVLPWYKRCMYEGVDLDGTWEYRFDQPSDFGSMLLRISQSAHELKGDAAVTVRNNGNEINLFFSVQGTVWEGYTSLILKSKDRRVVAFSTLLLKVVENGGCLQGIYAFKNPVTDLPVSVDFHLYRK